MSLRQIVISLLGSTGAIILMDLVTLPLLLERFVDLLATSVFAISLAVLLILAIEAQRDRP